MVERPASMKLMALWAYVCMAIDAEQKASGEQAQYLFSHDAQWVWWLVAGGWLFTAIREMRSW